MATGGEKQPENSGPTRTCGATAVGDDNLDHHNSNDKHGKKREKTTPSSSSSSSESSWGEPVESTASAKNTKLNPTAKVSPTRQLRSASLDADDRSSPTGQPMDKLDDPDSYRIPSEVFSRTKSSTPMDWSVASNESLFSIQMGNMSFTKDHAFLLGKSDELGYDRAMSMGLSPMASPMRDRPPISSSPAKSSNNGSPKQAKTSSPLPRPPSNDHGITAAIEKDQKSSSEGGGASPGELRAVQMTHAEIKQNESGGGGKPDASSMSGVHPTEVVKDPSFHSGSLRRNSNASGASVKSFAFPILTGDGQHRSTQSQSQPPTPQAAQQDPVTPRSSDRDNVNNNNSRPSTPKSGENKGNQGGGVTGGQGSKWFSCFPCCPSRTS